MAGPTRQAGVLRRRASAFSRAFGCIYWDINAGTFSGCVRASSAREDFFILWVVANAKQQVVEYLTQRRSYARFIDPDAVTGMYGCRRPRAVILSRWCGAATVKAAANEGGGKPSSCFTRVTYLAHQPTSGDV
jgi:hypothetical protein